MFDFDINQIVSTLSIWAVPVLLAITLHEAAHGYVAKRWGDQTAWMLGRVTLNPIKHIDPLGTLALPLFLVFVGSPFLIGYAKPVPVNFRNLRDIKWGSVSVAIAGPAANLALAVASLAVIHIAVLFPAYVAQPLVMMGWASIQINIILMIFNMVPLLPLDGGRVLSALLKGRVGAWYAGTEKWGMPLILLLVLTGVLFQIIGPIIRACMAFFAQGLPS